MVAADEQSLDLDLEQLYIRWKSYPGQVAQNAPNLRKQVLMLAYLYRNGSLRLETNCSNSPAWAA